jgi:hypothetical protein
MLSGAFAIWGQRKVSALQGQNVYNRRPLIGTEPADSRRQQAAQCYRTVGQRGIVFDLKGRYLYNPRL